jgi:hypothetical protein
MSLSIWTACAGKSRLRLFRAAPWRVVEAQHVSSTRKLVESVAEQDELERIIESTKPPLPADCEHLHYLLFTPFRYSPPLRNGSRFGTKQQRGIWYGSDQRETALAEVAYYRLLFLSGSTAELLPLTLPLSVFQAHIATEAGIDLTEAPFSEYSSQLSSPTSYDDAQRCGLEMCAAGVIAFRFDSARAPGGTNLGIFHPSAFSKPDPDTPESWTCTVTQTQIEYRPVNLPHRQTLVFSRDQFEVDGELPSPAA